MMRAVAILVLLLGARAAAGIDQVERRGDAPPLAGEVSAADGGVRVRTESGAQHFVPWDRVRRVLTDDPAVKLIVGSWQPVADDLWRARSRVERHDTALAEPLLDRLFVRYRGSTHETALVVAEGLLRCRLARGAHDEAIIPALEVGRLRRAGVRTSSYAALPAVVDAETGLCPRLAPWWSARSTLPRSERSVDEYMSDIEDPITREVAALYRLALRRQLGLDVAAFEPLLAQDADDPGAALLQRLLRAEAPAAADRRTARESLERDLEPAPAPWREAWMRFALGVSLLRESGEGRRERGLVHLLNVPARFEHHAPYLAGVALARAARGCDEAGFARGAEALRQDLARRLPGHPSIDETISPPAPAARSKDSES